MKIGLQRDGFYKLFPLYLSDVAERTDPDSGEKEVVGYSIYFHTYSPYHGKRIHLEDLYVAPKYRSRGVATSLFQAIARVSLTFFIQICHVKFKSVLANILYFHVSIHRKMDSGDLLWNVLIGTRKLSSFMRTEVEKMSQKPKDFNRLDFLTTISCV